MMQTISLDIRTLSFITMSIALLFSVGIFGFGFKQKQFKGFLLLGSASASYGIGLFFLGYRDVLPDLITIVLANTLIMIGLVFYLEGSRRFLGIADRVYPIGIVLIVLNIGLFTFYTYIVPSVNNRILGISFISAILSFLNTREFIRKMPDHWRVPGTMLAIVFGSYGLFQVYRFFWTFNESPIRSFMDAGTIHAFAFIFIIILITGSSFGFIWMVSKKFENELETLANIDQLTKILNRRGLENQAAREFSKLKRIHADLSIILIDIDHFKNINDQFGHQIGDEVLAGFAKLIQENVRLYDLFGRLGGEEFVILLPNTNIDQALFFAERLRKQLEENIFEFDNNQIQITASFGVTNYISGDSSLEKLLPYADKALYQSKQQGRNKVSHFSPQTDLA